MAEREGQQLGNYLLIRLIGYGGFAEVYLGEHLFLKTQAAIKVLTIQLTSENVEGFQKEAQTIARLVHPHIVRVLEFGVQGTTPYLVMDYAPNGTLRQKYARGTRLTPAEIAPYVRQASEALQYAHEQKLIHRDVKPENFLLGRNNEVLLSDFGIALVAQSSRNPGMQEVAGTVTYMSPEQIQGQPRPASDEYSLAIIVYEWLSGATPFHGTFTELCAQHLYAPPAPLRQKVPDISPAVEEVVMTALAKDPRDRFATVRAFASAFEQAIKSDARTVTMPTAGAPPPPLTPSRPLVPPALTPAPAPLVPPALTPAPPPSGQVVSSGQMPPSLEQYAELAGLPTTEMQLPVEPGKLTPVSGQLPPAAPLPTPVLGISLDQIPPHVFSDATYVRPVSQEPLAAEAQLAAGAPPPEEQPAASPALAPLPGQPPSGREVAFVSSPFLTPAPPPASQPLSDGQTTVPTPPPAPADQVTVPTPPPAAPIGPPSAAPLPVLAPLVSQADQLTIPPRTPPPAPGSGELATLPVANLVTPPTFQAPPQPDQSAETLPGWKADLVAPQGRPAPGAGVPAAPSPAPGPLAPMPFVLPPFHPAQPPPPPARRGRSRRVLVLALVVILLFLGGGAALFAFMQAAANPRVVINPTATFAPTTPADTATSLPVTSPTTNPTAGPTDTATSVPTATDTPQPGPTNTPKPRPTSTPKPPPALTAPAQISPASGSSFNVSPHDLTLKWGSVAGATLYRLQIFRYPTGATSCSGGSSSYLDTQVSGTSYSFTFSSAADQPGCWRVAALGNGTQGPYSPLWLFVFTQ